MKTSQFIFLSVTAMLSISLMVGCGEKMAEQPAQQSATSSTSESDHGHPHEDEGAHGDHGTGPHDGTLSDWAGGKYHVEFTVDHDKKQATVYVMGSDLQTPEPITIETLQLTIRNPQIKIDLLPVPLDGESGGRSSRFVGTHNGLATVMEYEGTMSAEIDGTLYAGNFKEEAHLHAEGHSHGDDDELVWEGKQKEHAGLVIKLGHHGKYLHAGEEVEPAVSITQDGEDVSDAKIFNALFSADGRTELAKEVPTVYEPTTQEEPAHYAQGALAIPKGVTKVVLRFRVVLSGADAVTFDVPIKVE